MSQTEIKITQLIERLDDYGQEIINLQVCLDNIRYEIAKLHKVNEH